MRYEFEDVESGEVIEVEMPMTRCVSIGNHIRRRGRKLKRVASLPTNVFKPISGVTLARSLPRNHPGADFYLKDGTPGFRNDHSKRDFCAHSADHHEEPVHMLDDII